MNRRSSDTEMRVALRTAVGVAVFACLVGAVAMYTSLKTLPEVRRNTDRLAMIVPKLERVERLDTRFAHRAQYRNCARDMLTRAEQYVSQEVAVRSPLIRSAFPPELIRAAQERRARNFPILDCAANLRGEIPEPLSLKAERRYIRMYAQGKLDPTPR